MKRILLFRVGQSPEIRLIEDSLEAMQKTVGGMIEMVNLEHGVDLVCNEEGKLLDLDPNRYLPRLGDVICGNFFLVGIDHKTGKSVSLTAAQIKKWQDRDIRAVKELV